MAIIRKPVLDLAGRRFDHVVFYRLPCGLICRVLNPHTRKRILKDPKFAGFRKCSKLMAKASKIGSAVYKSLPEDFRQFWMYRAFVGEAFKMLKDGGMKGEQVLESLFKTYVEVWHIKAAIKQAEKGAERRGGSGNSRRIVKVDIHWKEFYETSRLSAVELAILAGACCKPAGSRLSGSFGLGPPGVYDGFA